MSTVHDFQTSLRLSHGYSDKPWWESVYREAFGPEYVGMFDAREDGAMQRAGVDRYVFLRDRDAYRIDEKVRTEDYDDILLEIWSNWQRCSEVALGPTEGADYRIPVPQRRGGYDGWAVKPQWCDFIAYAFAPSGRCYLLPHATLRRALRQNWLDWRDQAGWDEDVHSRFGRSGFIRGAGGFGWAVARNPTYTTVSLSIPIPVLMQAVADAMLIRWVVVDEGVQRRLFNV